MIGGVVLAAGRSTRMGRPKALLDAGGSSFLGRCVEALRGGGCAPVVVVLAGSEGGGSGGGSGGDPGGGSVGVLSAEAAAWGGTVVTGKSEAEQVESIRIGLDALPARVEAGVVLPVDHPLVHPATVAALIGAWRRSPERIIRPVHEGVPGHPTVFPRAVWPSLVRGLERGARTVVEDEGRPRTDLMVDDPGVVADIDTPEAYARWLGP